jgi:hypothetical protein
MKICAACGVSKAHIEFHRDISQKDGLRHACKPCVLARRARWRKEHPDAVSAGYKRWYETHRAQRHDTKSQWRAANIEHIRSYEHKRLASNTNARIAHALRRRLRSAIKANRAGSAVTDLGCTIDDLCIYLHAKFVSGMTWENYGEWHIDHIIPLSAFDLTDRAQFLRACHYTNLQPLWASDNLRKGDRYEPISTLSGS